MPFEIEYKTLPVSQIKPNPKNEAKHSAEQVSLLADTIARVGYDVPIVVDEGYVVLKGHARLSALKKLKTAEARCIIRRGLSEEEKATLRLADNKIGEMFKWDYAALEETMKEVGEGPLSAGGFSDKDITDLASAIETPPAEKGGGADPVADFASFWSVTLVFSSPKKMTDFRGWLDKAKAKNKALENGDAALELVKAYIKK